MNDILAFLGFITIIWTSAVTWFLCAQWSINRDLLSLRGRSTTFLRVLFKTTPDILFAVFLTAILVFVVLARVST